LPTGGVGHTVFPSFSAALLVAGGSGISFALSQLSALVSAAATGRAATTTVELVWTVQDPGAFAPFLPELDTLLARARACGRLNVRVTLAYTRALTESGMKLHLPSGVRVAPGRPRVARVLDGVLSRAVAAGGQAPPATTREPVSPASPALAVGGGAPLQGLVVAVCGPPAMCADVARAVRGVSGEARRAVGGLELHEEYVAFPAILL
jgi:ferric-chelate reductase